MHRIIDSEAMHEWRVYFILITLSVIPYFYIIQKLIKRYLFSPLDHSGSINTEIAGIVVCADSVDAMLLKVARHLEMTMQCSMIVILIDDSVYSATQVAAEPFLINSTFQNSTKFMNFTDVADPAINRVSDRCLLSCSIALEVGSQQLSQLIIGDRQDGFAYNDKQYSDMHAVAKQIALGMIYLDQLKEINAFNITLQEKIKQSTRSLRMANAKIKRLSKGKDDLISIASHQLTASRGLMEIELPDSIKKTKFGEMIFDSNQRMTSIVTDMLNLGRLDMGKLEVQKESVELESIIKDQIELLRYVASNKNVYPIHEVKLPVRI